MLRRDAIMSSNSNLNKFKKITNNLNSSFLNLNKIFKYISGDSVLSNEKLIAADIKNDGQLKVNDIVALVRVLTGETEYNKILSFKVT